MKKNVIALICGIAASGLVAAADSSDVSYPEGYEAWYHIKSMVIEPGHPLHQAVGGFHSIYANPKALKGYRSGKSFPTGSVIVFDLYEAVDAGNAIAEGKRKAVIVMAKESKYGGTDSWGYQVFDATSGKPTIDDKAAADCHSCHTQQQNVDFVFSALRQ